MINLGIMGSIAASNSLNRSRFTFETWTDKDVLHHGFSLENRANFAPWDIEPVGSVIEDFIIEYDSVEYELMAIQSFSMTDTQWYNGVGFRYPIFAFKRVDRLTLTATDTFNIGQWWDNNQITIYPDNGDANDRFYGDVLGIVLKAEGITQLASIDRWGVLDTPPSELIEQYVSRKLATHDYIRGYAAMTHPIHTHWHESVVAPDTKVIIEIV